MTLSSTSKKHPKTPENKENGEVMDVCAAPVDGGTHWRQLFVLLHCTKEDSATGTMGIVAQSFPFFLCQAANKKNPELFIFDFLKIGWWNQHFLKVLRQKQLHF